MCRDVVGEDSSSFGEDEDEVKDEKNYIRNELSKVVSYRQVKREEQFDEYIHMKVIVVGDAQIGKTSFVTTYVNGGRFPATLEVPRVVSEYNKRVYGPRNRKFELLLWDVSCEERLRPLVYNEADVVFCCYSLDNVDSLKNVREVWVPEVRHFSGARVPIVLVGLKSDVADGSCRDEVTELCKELEIDKQVTVSAKCNSKEVEKVFDEAMNGKLKQKGGAQDGDVGVILKDAFKLDKPLKLAKKTPKPGSSKKSAKLRCAIL